MTVTVSVVICAHTFDRFDDIQAAVASVRAQTRPTDEVLLVIDHNDELLNALSDIDAKVVPNTGPKGLSGGRNTGTDLASGDVVAYLDDDAVACPDWLAHLVAPFEEDPRVVAVGGWAHPAWDTAAPAWFPAEFYWVLGCSHRGLPTSRARVRNVIGCNMAYRRRAVIDAGGFDTGLGRTADRPLGCEETELCIRLHQLDPRAVLLLEPRAEITHRVPEGRTRWRYFVSRCRAEGNSKAHVSSLV
ncbi:MAG: glycosyltransferase, partial [Acidimicrobiia bacterium]|nr:glycosyltransferase [Acidimicrobiia bacterium]